MSNAKRIGITIPEDLLEALDKAAESTNLNRSAYIAVAVTQKIQQDEVMKSLPYLVHKMQKADVEEKRD